MNVVKKPKPREAAARPAPSRVVAKQLLTLDEHVIEIMSDSGEGAQKCGQSFGAIAARMGNGVWTVEIIPAYENERALRVQFFGDEIEKISHINPLTGEAIGEVGSEMLSELGYAIETAAKSLRDLRIAEVGKLDVKVEDGKVTQFRTRLSLSFKYGA